MLSPFSIRSMLPQKEKCGYDVLNHPESCSKLEQKVSGWAIILLAIFSVLPYNENDLQL